MLSSPWIIAVVDWLGWFMKKVLCFRWQNSQHCSNNNFRLKSNGCSRAFAHGDFQLTFLFFVGLCNSRFLIRTAKYFLPHPNRKKRDDSFCSIKENVTWKAILYWSRWYFPRSPGSRAYGLKERENASKRKIMDCNLLTSFSVFFPPSCLSEAF